MSRLCRFALVLGLLLAALPVRAQEVKKVEGEQAQEIARLVTDAAAKLTDLPLKVTTTNEGAVGLGAGEYAALLVPAAGLKAEAVKGAGTAVVPVGVLYTHKIIPVVADQPVAAGAAKAVDVTWKDRDLKVAAHPLGVAKVAGRLVLLVYGSDKAPVVVTTLAEAEGAGDKPLDVEGRKSGEARATLVITLLGKYRAALEVAGE